MSPTTILLIIVMGSIFILIVFSIFILHLIKLYNNRQIEFTNNMMLNQIENEKRILSTRIEVYEETIQNISREIHDNVNQLLTLSKLNLNSIDNTSNNENRIQIAKDLITTAIGELTNISRSLSAEILNEVGLFRSIEIETERLNKINLIEIETDLRCNVPALNPDLQLIIYRIFQESLRNSIIHGKASKIKIELELLNQNLLLTITDNGKGFDYTKFFESENFVHQGLKNMKKRIELVNGKMIINSKLEQGTVLVFEIPIMTNQKDSINNFISHPIHN
ncbi:sensor histidine kinase [Flavihumibacter profundi]|uniref:sensor histidine kinase n=1 Tax=Flavihumibacter profundi TaxID=2716883 RepID=UPI001CC6F93F|nr:ATP-binding protein [Flavihumibacter profundi]MBZ5857261.1 histidine kinase [Flavihumibacter profundi]